MKRPSVTGQTKIEVIEKLRLLAAQALSPEAADPSKLTVKEWIEVYFKEFKNEELSPTTIRDYRSIMDNHVILTIGDMQYATAKGSPDKCSANTQRCPCERGQFRTHYQDREYFGVTVCAGKADQADRV